MWQWAESFDRIVGEIKRLHLIFAKRSPAPRGFADIACRGSHLKNVRHTCQQSSTISHFPQIWLTADQLRTLLSDRCRRAVAKIGMQMQSDPATLVIAAIARPGTDCWLTLRGVIDLVLFGNSRPIVGAEWRGWQIFSVVQIAIRTVSPSVADGNWLGYLLLARIHRT